jgi:hypothetical protein
VGAKGAEGDQGPPGRDGIPGWADVGERGSPGDRGFDGLKGIPGTQFNTQPFLFIIEHYISVTIKRIYVAPLLEFIVYTSTTVFRVILLLKTIVNVKKK